MNIKVLRMSGLFAVLALLISSCGTPTTVPPANTLAPVAADTPIPAANTPLPATNTAEPTAEPSLAPTSPPAPAFNPTLLLSQPDLPAYSRSFMEVRKGTGTDDQTADSRRSVDLEFDRAHSFSHSNVDVSGLDSSGNEFANQAILYRLEPGLLAEIVDMAKLYFSNELAEAYQANSLENPTASIVESMETISTTVTTESPFGWITAPVFVGQETQNDIACNHFTFDQTSIDTTALPEGMTIDSASGNLCLAVEGGYLVHGDGKMEGQNLHSSPKSEDVALKTGSIEFIQDLKLLEPEFSTGLLPEILAQVSSPAEIALPAEYRLAMSQITEGGLSYMYISDQALADITAHFKTEMPALGWTLVSSEENAGTYTYKLSKDDLNITVIVVDGVTLPGIKTITIEKSP